MPAGLVPEIPDGVDWWDPLADNAVRPDIDAVLVNGSGSPGAAGSGCDRPARRRPGHLLRRQGRHASRRCTRTSTATSRSGSSVDDDPAAELHDWYGRYLYFAPDEVEPLGEPSTRQSTSERSSTWQVSRLDSHGDRRRWSSSAVSAWAGVGAGRPPLPQDTEHVADLDRHYAARILVAGIGNIFLGRRRLRPRGAPPCRRHGRRTTERPRHRLRHPRACTWPTTCSRTGTRWCSSTRCPDRGRRAPARLPGRS